MTKKRILMFILAAVLLFTALSGCRRIEVDEDMTDNDEFYTIRMYLPFNTAIVPTGLRAIEEKVNEITKRELNAAIEITGYNYNEYVGKVNNEIASGVSFDLFFTNASSYQYNFNLDSMYPIGKIIDKYAPDVRDEFNAIGNLMDQLVMPDGKTYALPNMQILPRSASMRVRDRDQYHTFLYNYPDFSGKTLTEIEDIIAAKDVEGKYDIIEAYMKYCRDNNLGSKGSTYGIDFSVHIETFMDMDDLCQGTGVPGAIYSNESLDENGKLTIINQFKEEDFRAAVLRATSWYDQGYIPRNASQVTMGVDNVDIWPYTTWKPSEISAYASGGVTKYMSVERFGEPVYKQSYIMGTMWSVSKTSKNAARAVKFLNLLHTNSEVHNLLKFGVEGTHYELLQPKGDTPGIVRSFTNSNYNNSDSRWILGNEMLGYITEEQSPTIWQETKAINEGALVPEFIGFVFDRRPVINEIQACNAVFGEYTNRFKHGKDYREYSGQYQTLYDEFIAKMDKAGAQKIIDEKQKQLDEWLASKK